MKLGRLVTGILAVLIMTVLSSAVCRAEIAGDEAFDAPVWNKVYEEEISGPGGVVQSVCAAGEYIICIENTSDATGEPDVVSAYARTIAEDGKEKYSLVKRNTDMDWEHGNGMAYNPDTGEIYVALYTSRNPENRGCLFVMDPQTLEYKRKIKISDDYNILGIGYKKDTDQYIIQTNVEGGYSFKVLNSDFEIVEDLGEYAGTAPGSNFQDLHVSEDYIINFPLTLGMGIGDYLNVYSISRKSMVKCSRLDFKFQDVRLDEPEGICEPEPGVYVAVVNEVKNDGTRNFCFYSTEIPYYYEVSAEAENGTVNKKKEKIIRGDSFPLFFAAKKGFHLTSMIVNGEEKEVSQDTDKFILDNIREDTRIRLVFSRTPLNYRRFVLPLSGVLCVLVFIGGYLYLIRIIRKRKKKASRIRIDRQRLIWQQEAEYGFIEEKERLQP